MEKLPVPPLENTLQKLYYSLLPHLSEDERVKVSEIINSFSRNPLCNLAIRSYL
jgi:hypothetical protein